MIYNSLGVMPQAMSTSPVRRRLQRRLRGSRGGSGLAARVHIDRRQHCIRRFIWLFDLFSFRRHIVLVRVIDVVGGVVLEIARVNIARGVTASRPVHCPDSSRGTIGYTVVGFCLHL
jgi:hypothetical protein